MSAMSRFTKTILSFLPFRGKHVDGSQCSNCDNCKSRASGNGKGSVKRKLEDDDPEGEDNETPAKKSVCLLQPPMILEQGDEKEEKNHEKINISDVRRQITESFNRLELLMKDLGKEEGGTGAEQEKDLQIKTPATADVPTSGEISKLNTQVGSLANSNTSAELDLKIVEKGKSKISEVQDDGTSEKPNKETEATKAGRSVPSAGEKKKKKHVAPPSTSSNTATTTPEGPKETSKPSVTSGTPTQENKKETPSASTADTKAKSEAPATSVATAPDPKVEAQKVKEETFIKEHEVILSPASGDADKIDDASPSSFSSSQLLSHNLEKQIEFLQENVLTPTKYREMFTESGLLIPKGIYFHGPGVTSSALILTMALASELSKELGKPVRLFRKVDTDILGKYGEEWKTFVPNMFSVAVKHKPSIVLIQDIDVVCNYCDHDISTNKEMVRSLAAEMDKIIPGEVLVIFTLKDLNRSFTTLRNAARFQKYLEFPQSNSVKSIILNLKLCTSKWTKNLCDSSPRPDQAEREKILEEIADKIFKTTPPLDPDDVAQLCRDVYQKSFQTHLKSLPHTTKSCACKCCVVNLHPDFPALSQWAEALSSIVALKKSANPLTGIAKLLHQPKVVPEVEPQETLSFAQVGGLSQQIDILKENILVPLMNKQKLKELGWSVEPVRGFIFHGPPGTGKTLLGKALAAELGRLKDGKKFSFVYHKGTECYGMYVGQTEGKLREIFENAKKKKPAIIFLDEIDGLCATRNESGNSKFHDGVVTTILGLMDNIPRGEVFVIAATNRLAVLDPALRRPGRFDKCLEFQAPKLEGRKNILEIHTSTWKTESKLSPSFLEEIANKTGGYTGADLEQLCRQAFVFAMRRHTAKSKPEGDETTDKKEEDGGLENLLIQEEDWYLALRVVRSSGGDYFGAKAAISDKIIPEMATVALESRVEAVTEKLNYFFKKEQANASGGKNWTEIGIDTFLVWGNGVKQQKVIDNLLVPSLLSSKAFSSTVAVKLDLSMSVTEMATVLHNVINPGEDKLGILVVQNVDELLDPAQSDCKTRTAHRKLLDQLEVLRGEKVLLLGTSGKKPVDLAPEVQALFRDMEDSRRFEFKPPSELDIGLVFQDVIPKMASTTFNQIVKMLASSNNETLNKKDVNIYDLLDFKSEINRVLKRIEKNDGIPKEDVDKELMQLLERFVSNLQDRGKFKTSLQGMYT